MNSIIYYKNLQKYLLLSIILFSIVYGYLYLTNRIILPSNDIVIIQITSLIFFLGAFTLGIRLNTRSVFILIFFYQAILSIFFFLSKSFEYNVDYFSYSYIARLPIKDIPKETIDFSDWGYSLILHNMYKLGGGRIGGDLLVCILNIFTQIPTTYFVWKLTKKLFSEKEAKIAILLWGLNIYSIWFNATGLKESIFVFIITGSSYYMYMFMQSKKTKYLLPFLLFVISSIFFRYYVTIFFVIVFFLRIFFQKLYEKYFLHLCLISLAIILFGDIMIAKYFSDVMAIVLQREALWKDQNIIIGTVFNVISAFISPYPAINFTNQNVNLLTSIFSVFKVFFSVWGLYGMFILIRNRQSHTYPLINILFFNILLTIISGFSLNYRYMHITMPLYTIFIAYGFKCCQYKKIISFFYIPVVLILMVIYNLR